MNNILNKKNGFVMIHDRKPNIKAWRNLALRVGSQPLEDLFHRTVDRTLIWNPVLQPNPNKEGQGLGFGVP